MPAVKMKLPSGIEVEFASASEAAVFVRDLESSIIPAVPVPVVALDVKRTQSVSASKTATKAELPPVDVANARQPWSSDGLAKFRSRVGQSSKKVLAVLVKANGEWVAAEELGAKSGVAPKGLGSVLGAVERTAVLSKCSIPIERETRGKGVPGLRVRLHHDALQDIATVLGTPTGGSA